MVGIIIGISIVAFFILIGISEITSRKKTSFKNDPIPELLGIHEDIGIPIVQKLENSLTSSYVDNVKNRVLQNHPKWKDHEFEWAMFELKRYFVMNSLLKSVPMFSHTADEVWHEMLMFTRDYEKFSKDFYQDTLHHTPNLDSTPIPGERAFFDWVYISLFEMNSNSRAIWGRFLQNPIKREILDDFQRLSEDELIQKYFRKSEEWIEVKRYIINKMKIEIQDATQVNLGSKKLSPPNTTNDTNIYLYAAGAAVFYSINDDDQFQDQMSGIVPDEYERGAPFGGGSSCSGFACGSDAGDSGGGDSGGSSCSSCGGGCSS